MKDIKLRILDAALQVFMRYGVARSRMSDIATEAGVVRQTLYSFFDNKDDILCATIRHYSDMSLAEIKCAWEDLDSCEDKLDAYYERAILSSFTIISASPDARDMIGGHNAAGRAETQKAQAEKTKAWAEVLAQYLPAPRNSASSITQLAEFIVLSSLGLRDQAQDLEQLNALLDVQKQSVLAYIHANSTP